MTAHIAIFSDLHGNSAATEAVLAAIDAEEPDAVYCLGDLVGYGAKPNETIAQIRKRGVPTIMGNYDDGVGFDRDDCGCAYKDPEEAARGQQSLVWTRAVTTEENKAYLRSLLPEIRFEAEGKRFRLVHGSPRRMNEYVFEDRDPRSLARIAQGAASRRMAIPVPPGHCSLSRRAGRCRWRCAGLPTTSRRWLRRSAPRMVCRISSPSPSKLAARRDPLILFDQSIDKHRSMPYAPCQLRSVP
jgi:predicted phosphodiesterase